MSGARGSLLPDGRRLIAERLRRHGSVSVSALENEFAISPMTARRDLDALARRGVARRRGARSVVLTAGVERRLLEPFTRAGVDVRQV